MNNNSADSVVEARSTRYGLRTVKRVDYKELDDGDYDDSNDYGCTNKKSRGIKRSRTEDTDSSPVGKQVRFAPDIMIQYYVPTNPVVQSDLDEDIFQPLLPINKRFSDGFVRTGDLSPTFGAECTFPSMQDPNGPTW